MCGGRHQPSRSGPFLYLPVARVRGYTGAGPGEPVSKSKDVEGGAAVRLAATDQKVEVLDRKSQ